MADARRRGCTVGDGRVGARWFATPRLATPWLATLALLLGAGGCGSDQTPESLRTIERLEAEAFDGDRLKPEVRDALLKAYGVFSHEAPDHPFVAEALFRRADLLVSKGNYPEAIRQLTDVHDGYPTYENRARCAFLVAFIYDEHMQDNAKAAEAYGRVMSLHPTSPEAELARQSLALMGRPKPWE